MKDITDYFKSSPTSSEEVKCPKTDEKDEEAVEVLEPNSSEKTDENHVETLIKSKTNAFQFLMNSRSTNIISNGNCEHESSRKKAAVRRKLSPIDSNKSKKFKMLNSKVAKTTTNLNYKAKIDFDSEKTEIESNYSLASSCANVVENLIMNPRERKKKIRKNWKLRIKLCSEEPNEKLTENCENIDDANKYQQTSNAIETIEIDDSEKDTSIEPENIESKRLLRNRNSLKKPIDYSILDTSTEDFEDDNIRPRKSSRGIEKKKNIVKPMTDPEVLEARRKFLSSETPRIKTRNKIERQTSVEFDVFPKISHITQLSPENLLNYVQEPLSILSLKTPVEEEFRELTFPFNSFIDRSSLKRIAFKDTGCVVYKKDVLKNLKLKNENYPVYKTYRLLEEKFKNNPEDYLAWTEKYKPRSSEDFIGNIHAISNLKKWLENWNELFKKGNFRSAKNSDDSSDSDFISSEPENITISRLSQCVILIGPNGSGKTSSVYAICNELGLHVIEMNASSRRTGKHFLQEFQEATKSHQIRKNKKTLFPQKVEKTDSKESKKMCVLLIEDIDLVFEQDEGFISAIYQVLFDSKIPIILTTANEKSLNSKKFMNEFKTIRYHQFSAKILSIWFQILCLIEGFFVDNDSIYEFLEYNNGDIRKSLLGMQYWIQTGGQIDKNKNSIDSFSVKIDECLDINDDSLDNFPLKTEQVSNNCRTHMNIVADFEVFQIEKFYNIPSRLMLGKVWWNIPKFLNFGSDNAAKILKKSQGNRNNLKLISELYDSLALCDLSERENYDKTSFCEKRWRGTLTDSLELNSSNLDYSSNHDFKLEWGNYFLERRLNACKQRFVEFRHESHRTFNMAKPGLAECDEIVKKNRVEDELMNAVPISSHLDHNSLSTDYLPAIRNIIRSEEIRAQNNTKRRNRFFNYLQSLNVDCNQKLLDSASNTFMIRE